ncbi:MAG TPA: ATP-binding protein [Candidatus Deferrimicrobium sp.]|nr:ATP-binding protein [Candidatus Deferrimicrobium sp.]
MITRFLNKRVKDIIDNQVSFLVLGPRQTGKTTFIKALFQDTDYLEYNFMESRVRRRFEQDPSLIIDEIEGGNKRFIFIDEVQKVPEVLDNIQVIIDRGNRIIAITGSSARKLKRKGINLLPGRIVEFKMDPLFWEEYRDALSLRGQETIRNILKFGELPRVFTLVSEGKQEIAAELLYSYVNTYLEEEIRVEAQVRNIGIFNKFLKLAAEESGKIVSFRNLSQDLGIPHQTVSQYYQILSDCLIVEEIEALVPASQRGKTVKSSKVVFFDTGVANAAAEVLGPAEYLSEYWGNLFEQWVGLTILKYIKINGIKAGLYYWRDYNGREVDWVVEYQGRWLPIEVKWTDMVKNTATKHIEYFLDNFSTKALNGCIIFTGSIPTRITDRITAFPYFDLVRKVLMPFFA